MPTQPFTIGECVRLVEKPACEFIVTGIRLSEDGVFMIHGVSIGVPRFMYREPATALEAVLVYVPHLLPANDAGGTEVAAE